jgi:hypothetical protein
MAVMNVPVFFSVLDARQNLAVVELERNNHAIDLLLQESEMFCTAVDEGTGIEDFLNDFTAEQITSLIKPIESPIELDSHVLDLINTYEVAKEAKKIAEESEKAARDQIARLLRGFEVGTVNGVKVVSWKQQAGKKSVDIAAMREAHPEIVAQFEREGNPFRVMRTTKKKEK